MSRPRSKTTEARELAILRFLKQRSPDAEPATVKEIWEAGNAAMEEDLSIQAYYRLIDRMEATKRLTRLGGVDGDAARFALAPYLDVDNALTLDDVYEILGTLGPTEALARVMDARRYFEERRRDTLAQAARALQSEDPRELVERFLLERLAALAADVNMLRRDDLRDRELEQRTAGELREAALWAYRWLGLSLAAVDVTAPLESLMRGTAELHVDAAAIREELRSRVFGDAFIMSVRVEQAKGAIAGSDGSTHASALRLRTAATFDADTAGEYVTFNNSVVFVDSVAPAPSPEYPYYSIPISRSALDDPGNRGMVLAPFMYRYLSDSEYEHMAKCATDVVQWRCDQAVFLGTARAISGGDLLPRPTVHFRDGTVTPQEREYGHYRRHNEYGDMVREGLRISRTILERVISAPGPAVFAGAVKSTQMRFFSSLLNWYIARGSAHGGEPPLDAGWDMTRAAHISDNEAMSVLLSTLDDGASGRRGAYFVTFALLRPFHALTEFYNRDKAGGGWDGFFEAKRQRELDDFHQGLEGDYPHLARVVDVADDDFVYLCNSADYVAFYVGHTAGDPPPVAPRYEFLDSFRGGRKGEAPDRVRRGVELIVAAIAESRLSYDLEHNFLSDKNIVRVVPHVVYDAHEKCKALGRKFEAELKSIVIANLQALHGRRALPASDVEFAPVSVRAYVERYRQLADDDRQETR